MSFLEENKKHAAKNPWILNHVFTIKDTATGRTMTSVGRYTGGNYSCGEEIPKDLHAYYSFKTANNEAGVKEIEYENGKYKIEAMMRNKPIPKTFEVVGYTSQEKYTEEEKQKMELMAEIHLTLKRRCGYFSEYLSYSPGRTLNLTSINRTIVAEYFTPDWFGENDIINYRTDHIRMKALSVEDLKLVKSTLL